MHFFNLPNYTWPYILFSFNMIFFLIYWNFLSNLLGSMGKDKVMLYGLMAIDDSGNRNLDSTEKSVKKRAATITTITIFSCVFILFHILFYNISSMPSWANSIVDFLIGIFLFLYVVGMVQTYTISKYYILEPNSQSPDGVKKLIKKSLSDIIPKE